MLAIIVNELDVMGGTHKQVLRLCQYLEEKKTSYKIFTKRFDLTKTYPEFSGFDVEAPAFKESPSNLFVKFLVDIYLQLVIFGKLARGYEIVNVHDNGFPLVIALSRLFGKRVYWQINDLPWVFSVGNSKDLNYSTVRRVYAYFARIFYRFVVARSVERITVNVSKNRARVAEHLGVESEVYYCGVDVWDGPRVDRSIGRGGYRLLTSGVFFPYRNYETQLEIVKNLLSKGYDVKLNIIGSTALNPEYSTKIENLIHQSGLDGNVIIHGQVSHQKYQELHDSSNVFLFLNVDQSWGLSVFEAMSAGLPVIVSKSVGAVEILHDYEDSIVVDPYDVEAVVESLEGLGSNELYRKLSTKGASYVRELTWDEMYSRRLCDLMEVF